VAHNDVAADDALGPPRRTDPAADALAVRSGIDERVARLRDLVHLPAEHRGIEPPRLRCIRAVDLEIRDGIAHMPALALLRDGLYVSLHLPMKSSHGRARLPPEHWVR